eukprot:TRINITY_DN7483_c0_g1_i1.p2 TRINITY_DN7483_c0_g1~~TRINITY_DN7483_c0_g1_i1.p2  ORF type:complete len:253 (-),score=22.94 TRINITY_DN7483_c0_g1_i1:10-768(-)
MRAKICVNSVIRGSLLGIGIGVLADGLDRRKEPRMTEFTQILARMPSGVRLVVGLGNGGPLAHTRHSVGHMFADYFAREVLGASWKRVSGCRAFVAEGVVDSRQLLVAKTAVPMNVSGPAVLALMRLHNVDAAHLLVVCDELDLKLGSHALRPQGSARGHNGLRSLIASLQTTEFARLCIGIGRPADRDQVAEYVLEPFSLDERTVLAAKCEELCRGPGIAGLLDPKPTRAVRHQEPALQHRQQTTQPQRRA